MPSLPLASTRGLLAEKVLPRVCTLCILPLLVSSAALGQETKNTFAVAQAPSEASQGAAAQAPDTSQTSDPERWNLFYQATSIGDEHGAFPAKYSGPLSLENTPEHDVSLTTTLFLGLRLAPNTQLYFNPEIAGGRGFSGVDGVANAPNGELPRVASATPKPYLARLYLVQDFGFGDDREAVTGDANQLGGSRPAKRYTIIVGRFTLTDFFDNNTYSHDPRSQFMGWAVMFNGAWDYPADTRGYTWGWVHEFHTKNWSVRYGSAAMPKVANGLRFDRRLFVDRGDVVEGERDFAPGGHAGAVRVLGYANHADAGSYAEALSVAARTGTKPDVVATRVAWTFEIWFRHKRGTGSRERYRPLRAARMERR